MAKTLHQHLEDIIAIAIKNAPLQQETDVTPLVEFATANIEQAVLELVERAKPEKMVVRKQDETDREAHIQADTCNRAIDEYHDNLIKEISG
jgi:hypothetical protein